MCFKARTACIGLVKTRTSRNTVDVEFCRTGVAERNHLPGTRSVDNLVAERQVSNRQSGPHRQTGDQRKLPMQRKLPVRNTCSWLPLRRIRPRAAPAERSRWEAATKCSALYPENVICQENLRSRRVGPAVLSSKWDTFVTLHQEYLETDYVPRASELPTECVTPRV